MINAVRSSRLALALSILVAVVLSVLAAPAAPALAPEPDPVPRRWQLEIKPGPLRVVTFDIKGVGTRKYFYFTYTVTNNTGQDLLFAPNFELATTEGELIRSGRDVPADVTKAILDQLENPLLQDQIGILGILLQGADNARDGLVVWPCNDIDVDEINIYAAGFSGETRAVEVKDPKSMAVDRVMLRKSLMLRYRTPGEIRNQGSTPLEQIESRWILR